MINLKLILKIIGSLLIVEGIALLIAFGVSLIYMEPDVNSLLISALICIIVGWITSSAMKNTPVNFKKNDGFLTVTLVWVVFSLFGSLPFIISGYIPSLTNAFFETMSGFTTTGSTILNNIEALPHGLLFWRSMTQWLGGMGIIVLSLAILPSFGIGGMQLFGAEVTGPVTDKLTPKIHETAKRLWGIYVILTLVETILLHVGGMNLFDAVNHSFTTISSGGYSTKQASVAYWNSPFIQYVIIFFMILAGTNFNLIYGCFMGRFNKLKKNEEFVTYLFIILGFTIVIFIGLLITENFGKEKTFRDALFQVVSIITTTGFATANYLNWIPFLLFILFLLFFFGGSTGSTAGNIKIMRIILMIKNCRCEIKRIIHPNAIIPIHLNRHSVPEGIIHNVLAFFMTYILIFIISSGIFLLIEDDIPSAVGAVASCLGNIGPALGNYGPENSFFALPDIGKWFLSFLMLLGRLELFTVLSIFSPCFWRE